jgi:hypothetical protein
MNSDKKKKILIAPHCDKTAQKMAEPGFAISESTKSEVTLLHDMSDMIYFASTEYSTVMSGTYLAGDDPLEIDSDKEFYTVPTFKPD